MRPATTKSLFPLPVKAPVATEVVDVVREKGLGAISPPVPLLKMMALYVLLTTMIPSGLPLWNAAAAIAIVPLRGAWKVMPSLAASAGLKGASLLPRKTPMEPACPTTISAMPSPLKSPTTMDRGLATVVGLWVEVVHVTPGNVCAWAGDPAIPPPTKIAAAKNEKQRSRTPCNTFRKRAIGRHPRQMFAIIRRMIR